MKNKDLRRFYTQVYAKKGEEKHYTKLVFGTRSLLPNEEREVISELSWKGKSVLDVGCGTGLICSEIAKRGAANVLGIDFSEGGIDEAQRLHKHPVLEYRRESLTAHYAKRKKYDVIISLGTLEHMDGPLQALKMMAKMVKRGGHLIVTCPNWTNPRGYILQTLRCLFDAPITRADLDYLTPIEFQDWSKKIGMDLSWRTFDHDWAHGERLIKDFKKRLPAVLRDAKLPNSKKNVTLFISWIGSHILPLDHTTPFSGATGLYHFKN